MNDKLILTSLLIISAALHYFVFQLFFVTVPVQDPAHQPRFIFLGSILDSKDISSYLAHKTIANNKLDISEIDLPRPLLYDDKVSKPHIETIKQSEKKSTFKTTFAFEPLPHPTEKEKDEVPVSLDVDIPTYEPLRLQNF